MAGPTIRLYRREDRRESFSCGNGALDSFLRDRVTQYDRRGLGKTYVAVLPDSHQVVGYYTIAAGALETSTLPAEIRKRLPKHEIPTVHLGRLAVDGIHQGKGLGALLLMHCLSKSLALAEEIGVALVEVHAIDDVAVRFYAKYGFMRLEDHPNHLFMMMSTVRDLLAPP